MVLRNKISRAVAFFMTILVQDMATSEQELWALEETGQPARLVGFRQLAPACVGALGIGNALGGNTVLVVDVVHPYQAIEANELVALVQAQPFLAADGQHTIGHHFRDRYRNEPGQGVALVGAGLAAEITVRVDAAAKLFNGLGTEDGGRKVQVRSLA